MPWIHRVLAENLLRNAIVHADARASADRWLGKAKSDGEIAFYPARILMHDTTCGPALVDLAALRSTIAEAGGDPSAIAPVLPVDVSTDHSLAVDAFGTFDAMAHNMAEEMRRNAERFAFMKWASGAFEGLRVHPPGTGIMHTLNLERLADVVAERNWQGERWRFPDTLIGTDSHTPMINGIGVLAWGVGGLEAEAVMLGMPVMLRVPEVIGVRLTGALREGVGATDLALTITQLLRGIDLGGRFVEFFGPGVAALSVGERAVVANMAPEFGGATGYFPIDARTIDYLRATGRGPDHLDRVEDYARRQHLWFDPAAMPDYHRTLTFDLTAVERSVAGPRRPQDRIALSQVGEALPRQAGRGTMPFRPIVLAAITSCTNTSDPAQLIAAGLVARRARALRLSPPAWTKTSLAPGSPAAARYLERAGLRDDLAACGFAITGYGCTVCIGNSGPLTADVADAIEHGTISPVAVLSGNRNFPGRVHRQIDDAFLGSPALVVTYALAGDFAIDIANDPIGWSNEGKPVFLHDLWPSTDEIAGALALAGDRDDYAAAYAAAAANPHWAALPVPSGTLYPWDDSSTYLRRPPFVGADMAVRIGSYVATPLLVLGDDITTDHISPAGAIPGEGEAAHWLIDRGEDPADLNVFSARRGNWEVMLRGAFTNRAVRNLLGETLPAGATVHAPSGDVLPLWRAAARYAAAGDSVVIVAGERYGMGSSRDWAAKGPALLGVRAILAVSFERIHRSNLINMGILPLLLPRGLVLRPGDRLRVEADADRLVPHAPIQCAVLRLDGGVEAVDTVAAIETASEVETLICGGMLPRIGRRHLPETAVC